MSFFCAKIHHDLSCCMISNFPFLCDCSHSHLCQKTTNFIYNARPIMLTCCSLQLIGPIMFVVYAAYMVTQKIRQRLGFRQFSFIHYISICILYVVVTTFCCSTLMNQIFFNILNLLVSARCPKKKLRPIQKAHHWKMENTDKN